MAVAVLPVAVAPAIMYTVLVAGNALEPGVIYTLVGGSHALTKQFSRFLRICRIAVHRQDLTTLKKSCQI
jgi:hypothetical protein